MSNAMTRGVLGTVELRRPGGKLYMIRCESCGYREAIGPKSGYGPVQKARGRMLRHVRAFCSGESK